MKVLHISTFTSGGAANSAIRIHETLLKSGVNSFFLTLENSDKKINNILYYDGLLKKNQFVLPPLTLKNWFLEKFSKKFSKEQMLRKLMEEEKSLYTTPIYKNSELNFTLFSYPETIYDITTTSAYKDADIIHLHWVANFIDYPSFFSKIDKPIIWTLHDENPYLGGFHYQDDVDRNITTYGFKEKQFITLKANFIQKIKDITIVSPSDWIANKAKSSTVFNAKKVKTIRYCLDNSIFKPRDKFYSRDLFNLPQNKKVVLVASQDLSVARKGVEYVVSLTNDPDFDDYLFVFAGSNIKIKKENVIAVGSIKDEILMSCLYSAADFFLLPSLLDNLPNTLIESLYCGTPVLAFNIGDFPDIFLAHNFGVLVEIGNLIDLKQQLLLLLNDNFLFDRLEIAKNANEYFSEQKVAEQYLNEYKLLLDAIDN